MELAHHHVQWGTSILKLQTEFVGRLLKHWWEKWQAMHSKEWIFIGFFLLLNWGVFLQSFPFFSKGFGMWNYAFATSVSSTQMSEWRDKYDTNWLQSDNSSHAGFLLSLFFHPEDGGDIVLRRVGSLSTDYTALHPRRQNSSCENLKSYMCKKYLISVKALLITIFSRTVSSGMWQFSLSPENRP
jgi:hypothetical protein